VMGAKRSNIDKDDREADQREQSRAGSVGREPSLGGPGSQSNLPFPITVPNAPTPCIYSETPSMLPTLSKSSSHRRSCSYLAACFPHS
jgi:hypothetical protein